MPFLRRCFFCLLAGVLCCIIDTQQGLAQIQQSAGLVLDGNIRMSGAIVHNKRTGSHSMSNLQGMFNIPSQKSDTLITKLLNYKTDTLIVTDPDNLVIRLKPASHLLKQVTIRDLAITPEQTYEQNKKEYKDIYWKGDDKHIFGFQPGIGNPLLLMLGINIDKLYSAISKQGQDARRLQHTLTRDYENSVVDQRFNRILVARITGYEGEKLSDFIMKYRPAYQYVLKANDYDLVKYIKQKMKEDGDTLP